MHTKLRFKPAILISLILFGFISGSCKKDELTPKNYDLNILLHYEPVKVLFQYDYSIRDNFRSGWFIDYKGILRKYNLPDNWESDSLGYYDFTCLNKNCNQSIIIGQVYLEKLIENAALIEGALNGEISEKVYFCCSFLPLGTGSFYCFSWDPEKKKIKRQLLSVSGDWSQINKTPEAIQLTEYLKDINQAVKRSE